jgi:hypothetical protein
MRSAHFCLAVATLAAAPGLLAAQVPTVTLTRPIAELAEPLDRAYSAAELPDGRVVVTDLMGPSVQMVDFAKGTVAPVGRSGAGPNEYRMPERVIPGAGDSLLVIDVGQRRLLRIAPDGKPAGTIPFPEAAGFGRFRGADRQGRLYYQGSRMGGTPGGRTRVLHDGPEAKPADSVPVIRWDPKSGRLDTMGLVLEPALARPAESSSGGRTVIMSRPEPFTPQDEWTVTRDGRVVMLRSGSYRADWRTADGRRGSGPPVTYEKVRVTQADKDRLTKGSRQAVIAGGAKIDMAPESASDFKWPAYKPPFQPSSAQATPDGRVWVQRSGADGAAPVYDEFDETGRLVRQIAVAKGSRVVGFGKGVVYVARTDEDDLVYLQKFAR